MIETTQRWCTQNDGYLNGNTSKKVKRDVTFDKKL